jgi:hypothetical protein
MKKLASGLFAFVLTFVIGVGATYVLNRVWVRFENVARGSIRMPPDGRGGFSSYKASDGVNLNFARLEFPSPDAARKAFQKVLSQATKIIERERLYNREGKAMVGERVVGMFPADDGREWPMVVCLDGANLYEISSTSLRHIALFEKAHRRF